MEIRFNGNTVEIDGYVNAVERLSKPLNTRLGGKFRERIKKGAFKRAIDRAEDVRLLINHDALPIWWKRKKLRFCFFELLLGDFHR